MTASASTVHKAIVPMAGLGTRLFPASHAIKKEFFPVVGPDGLVRAMFHYHLLDLADAGIEQVCLVVQPGEDDQVRAYLRGPDAEYLRRLEAQPTMAAEAVRMRELGGRVHFAVQREQEGYGHAVFQTRAFAAGQPVLLCLGDHLFRGRTRSPIRELADAWTISEGRSVSAVNRIGPDDLKGYGTIAGRRRAADRRVIDVTAIIEKPDVATARASLAVDGLPADTWLGWFGLHLLAPSIYDVLEEMIRDDVRDKGEFQLTRAQELQRQREGYLALEMRDAERFDFGTADDYVNALLKFRRS